MSTKLAEFKAAILDVIDRSTVKNQVLYLPGQIGPELFQHTKTLLESIGGKWNRSLEGFKFPDSIVEEAIAQLLEPNDENPKKAYSFYPTPPAIADLVVSRVGDLVPGQPVLVGDRNLARALWGEFPENDVDVHEPWPLRNDEINGLRSDQDAYARYMGMNFLEFDFVATGLYQLILGNPPFAKNQDVRHVRHMLKFVAPGGQLVSVMTKHWQYSDDAPSRSFRSLVAGMKDAIQIEEIPSGAFADSGTSVATCLFIFNG